MQLRLRRVAEDDVEACRQLADARAFERCEVDDDSVAGLDIADAAEDAVAIISRFAFDVALRCQQLFGALFHLEVNVRRSTGIRNRLDGPEVVFTG